MQMRLITNVIIIQYKTDEKKDTGNKHGPTNITNKKQSAFSSSF